MSDKGIMLMERDYNLFKYLLSLKIASSRQIQRDVFTGTTIKVVRKRLKKLQKSNYIRKTALSTMGTLKLGYTLSSKTFKAFFYDKKRKHNEFQSKSKEHDLTLVDIRNAFIHKEMVSNYVTENALLYSSEEWRKKGLEDFIDMRCDAVLKVSLKSEMFNIALEYEASMKYIERYKTLLKRYYQKKNIGAVFYICKNQEIMDKVKSIDKKLSSKYSPKFYFALLEDILSDEKELTLSTILDENFVVS